MRSIILLLALCMVVSCKNDSQTKDQKTEQEESPVVKKKLSNTTYTDDKWGFSLEHLDNWQIFKSQLAGDVPVINLYSEKAGFNPPFAIHEEPENAFLAILPKGFGVDAPSGKRKSLAYWNGNLSMDPELNSEESKVYLLESGEPWAFYLRFTNPPANWGEYGSVFVHFKVNDFKAECFSDAGEKKEMKNCDPMGPDEVRYYGNVEVSSKEVLMEAIHSFKFNSKVDSPISELIQVENPLSNEKVTSPIKINGKARGYWFFEANAPIVLLDGNNNQLAESYIKAEGEWMTEDFVKFNGSIEFDAPDDERGYLVFKRANPSDKKENDREFRLPVIFSHK
ncbi:MAG: Gmad2 immunoglobulin-like domain-containing protein [Christiangramia sp.]|nr:Gmad2 immunoglobulin-like domain-containing protein [Christiangramia sp.]